jgi:hypothetical protein
MTKTDLVAEEQEGQITKRIAELDAKVFRSIADRREASIEIGRALTEEKAILGHGKFQRHFAKKFASSFTLRTAERYMKRARKANSLLKIDSASIFKPASDQGAQEIREATDEAQAEVEAASNHAKSKKDSRHVYRLPLRMTADEIELAETLQQLPDWHRAERKIVRLLGELCLKYGVVSTDDRRHS